MLQQPCTYCTATYISQRRVFLVVKEYPCAHIAHGLQGLNTHVIPQSDKKFQILYQSAKTSIFDELLKSCQLSFLRFNKDWWKQDDIDRVDLNVTKR